MARTSLLVLLTMALVAIPASANFPAVSDSVSITVVVPDHGDETQPAVELYNPTPEPVILDGWTLHKFDPDHVFANACSVPLEGLLAPQGIQVVENPHTWSTCSWSASGNSLTLYDGADQRIDHVAWGTPGADYENAIPDGSGIERCFLLNPGLEPATESHWQAQEEPNLGSPNDPCLEG